MNRILPMVLFLAISASSALAATAQDTIREMDSLVKMNKPEQAFAAACLAVKADPSVGPEIRAAAGNVLQGLVNRAQSFQVGAKFNDTMVLLRPLWSAMLEPSAALLFESPEAYNAKLIEIYTLLFECTFQQAKFYEGKRNFVQAIYYAEMCVAYKPTDPDPRAVALVDSLKKQAEQSFAASPVVGTEFVLVAPDDDGFSGKELVNKPELRIGAPRMTACLSFPNVTIPQGARIKSAQIRGFFVSAARGPSITTGIGAELVDNATNVSPTAPLIANRPISPRLVQWSVVDPQQGWLDSPDIKSIIQEIVDRPGWKPGNRLNILCAEGRGTARFISFEEDPRRAFRLFVDW